MSIAKKSYQITGLYESELLVELMLRFWEHPLADDKAYRQNLLESAAEALRSAVDGIQLHPNLKANEMNLVAALWLAESTSLQTDRPQSASEASARANWLRKIEKSLPSCFCSPDDLFAARGNETT
jgi:hypothetical protein